MEVMRATDNGDIAESRETLMMFGGIALMIVGAGMIMSNPVVRRYLGNVSVSRILAVALPDVERYLKLKAM